MEDKKWVRTSDIGGNSPLASHIRLAPPWSSHGHGQGHGRGHGQACATVMFSRSRSRSRSRPCIIYLDIWKCTRRSMFRLRTLYYGNLLYRYPKKCLVQRKIKGNLWNHRPPNILDVCINFASLWSWMFALFIIMTIYYTDTPRHFWLKIK